MGFFFKLLPIYTAFYFPWQLHFPASLVVLLSNPFTIGNKMKPTLSHLALKYKLSLTEPSKACGVLNMIVGSFIHFWFCGYESHCGSPDSQWKKILVTMSGLIDFSIFSFCHYISGDCGMFFLISYILPYSMKLNRVSWNQFFILQI